MHNGEELREKLFTMRMSAEEWERAEKLAKRDGLTVAALVRMMLLARERELAASTKSKPRK
jgi:predicted DNA-binding protein